MARPDLLAELGRRSRERVAASVRAGDDVVALRARVRSLRPPPALPAAGTPFGVIAEIKRRAPSAGLLAPVGAEALARARAYVDGGAVAVSVLTEPTRFGGSRADLAAVAAGVGVPVLRKDFVVDPLQVLEARADGAAGVLLIAALLERGEIDELVATVDEAGLFVLLEVHAEHELERIAEHLGRADVLVGVNARDLRTLAIDRPRAEGVGRALDRPGVHARRVAESALATPADVAAAARSGHAFALVGTALMRAADPRAEVARLTAAGREVACSGS